MIDHTILIASVGTSVLEWVLVGLGLAAGLFLGMLWARHSGSSSSKETLPFSENSAEEAAANAADTALSALEKLQSLALSVRADVGQHSDQVQEINRELNEGDGTEASMHASLAKLLEMNQKLQSQLDSAEQKLENQAHEIEKTAADARTDSLTQITNRRGFDDFLARRVAEWQRRARPFCLLMMDIDHFKQFNDTHGHQAGDEVLRRVAASLSETSREMDFVTRYGGEEFAVIMADSVASEAITGCERMRAAIEEIEVPFEGKKLKVTVSQGFAEVTPADDAASIIRRADEALYASKSAGRNCGHFHDGDSCVHFGNLELTAPEEDQEPQEAPEETATTEAQQAPIEPQQVAEPQQVMEPAAAQSNLPNREIFQAELDRRIAESHRRGGELTVLLVEIDDFANFQEQFGNATGTKVYQTVGEFLGASFRKMDLIASAGETQFATMLPGTPLSAAAQIVGRMQEAIAKCKIPIGGQETNLTVSVGMAELSAVDDVRSLLARATDALEASRELGPNHAHAQTGSGCVMLAEVDGR